MKLSWVLLLFIAGACTLAFAQSNPVPFVNQPPLPLTVKPGSQSFTLTVNGTGFASGAIVNWNGTPLPTTFISSSQLTATVPAANVAKPISALVTVANPGAGLAKSNIQFVHVSNPTDLQFTNSFYGYSVPFNTTSFTAVPPIAADLRGSGKLDLAVAFEAQNPEYGTGGFLILDNLGDNTFQDGQNDLGDQHSVIQALVTGDFTGQGKLDLIVGEDDTITPPYDIVLIYGFWLGGDPLTRVSFFTFSGGLSGPQIATGDFNRDGKLDFADDAGHMYLGNGDGTFQELPFTPTAFLGGVGDYNGDGKLDLMACGTGGLAFLPGNGDGTFQQGPVISTLCPSALISADFNGDGKLDLAILGPSAVTILLGNGDGTFTSGTSFAVGTDDSALAADDLNADGKLDLAVSDLGSGNLYILLGNGDGTFQPPLTNATVGSPAGEVVAADFNGDGKTDLAVQTSNNILIMLQQTPMISLAPTSLTFGPQIVGTTNLAQPVTLTNAADATSPLTIASISAGGDFAQTNTCGNSVPINRSCTISVTFTPTAGGARQNFLTVSDNAPDSPQSLTLNGTGVDFAITPTSPTSVTVTPGQAANYDVSISQESGFNQTVALTCSGAPPQSTCTVTPNSVTLAGRDSAPAAIAVVTAGSSAALNPPLGGSLTKLAVGLAMFGGVLGFLAMPRCVTARRKRRAQFLGGLMLCLVSVVLLMPACGGGSGGGGSSGSGGTPTGTYNVTVTGTFATGSTKLTHSTNFTLVVQ
jgi:hypothetical protein